MTYNVTIFGIELTINPVAFTLPIGNGWDIYWYGIIIAIGFALAIVYGFKNSERFGINTDRMLDVVLVTTPVAILCARAYYVIFDGEKIESIGDFFGFSGSSGFQGIAIYGAVIGAFVCGAVMCVIKKINIFDMFDLAALGFLIGQGIGRWGNFVNQEAFGTLTGSSWWGMQSENTISKLGYGMAHPCFLYESIWCIAGFFIIHKLSKKRKFSGEVVLMYAAWYGFGRAIIETLRTDSLMMGNIRVSCLLSALLCLASVVTLFVVYNKMKKEKSAEYVPVFAQETEDIQEEVENEQDN